MDMFAMAIKFEMGEIPNNKLENLRVKTKFMALKSQKLNKVLEDLASNSPKRTTNWDTSAQLSETIYSETE